MSITSLLELGKQDRTFVAFPPVLIRPPLAVPGTREIKLAMVISFPGNTAGHVQRDPPTMPPASADKFIYIEMNRL